jgi:hypothetical protein
LRVGDSLQIYYKLPGTLGPGTYTVTANGVTTAADAMLHADIIHRMSGASDVILGGLDSKPPSVMDLHLQTWIQGSVSLPAVPGGSGDGLVLRVGYIRGSSDFSVIETSMTIP